MTTPIDPRYLRDGALDGRVAWITGGGSGLGQAMAIRYAELGAHVVVSGRREKSLAESCDAIRTAGGKATAVALDVRDPEGVEAAVAKIVESCGQLDILVNNAAGNFICPSEELTPGGFNAIVSIVRGGHMVTLRTDSTGLFSTRALPAVISVKGSVLKMCRKKSPTAERDSST